MSPEQRQSYRHPLWIRLRNQVLSRAKVCERCGCEVPTHAHHQFYRNGALAYEYLPHELDALCSRCHEIHHRTTPIYFQTWAGAPVRVHRPRGLRACHKRNPKQWGLPLKMRV